VTTNHEHARVSDPDAPSRGGESTSRRRAWAEALAERSPWWMPSIVALIGGVPTVWALYSQTFAIFGRDQGIFQYVGWALRNGERAYRDIHEINGPLPHAWHVVMQAVGGENEHTFRSIDTWMLVGAYALAGALLPRWVGLDLGTGRARRVAVAAFAAAGLTVLGSQYTRYDWWHTAQREALYAVLVLTSLGLQSIGHTTTVRRRALAAFALAGLATSLTWFGKPPCVIFAILQLGVLAIDRKSVPLPLRQALAAAIAGAFVSGAAMLAFALAYEDVGRGLELLAKVPRLHHTIWNETLLGAYRAYNNAPRLDWAMASTAGFAATFFVLALPRRALLAAVLPAGGFLVFAGQGKAFPYHLHMLTLGTAVLQLTIVAAIARWLTRARGSRLRAPVTAAALVGAIALGMKCSEDAVKSPGVRGAWATIGATAEMRATEAYFAHFPWGDFSTSDLRASAAYLAARTRPDERIQTYGFDPYLLFLARRKSASPVIYSFELNVDAALEGGPGARPSPELRAWLLAYRADAERLVLRSVEAAPPAAFTLHDGAPFTHPKNAEKDFAEHCPDLYAWMRERYVFARAFGGVRVWLRRDVMERSASDGD
jgi:hypothetical protein